MSIPVPGSETVALNRPRIRANGPGNLAALANHRAFDGAHAAQSGLAVYTSFTQRQHGAFGSERIWHHRDAQGPILLLPGRRLLATAGTAADRANPAAAASQTVTISKTGFKPTSVSITVGDTVVFSNIDTVAHTVEFKPTTGIHCTAALPLTLQAAKSASCTFANTASSTSRIRPGRERISEARSRSRRRPRPASRPHPQRSSMAGR